MCDKGIQHVTHPLRASLGPLGQAPLASPVKGKVKKEPKPQYRTPRFATISAMRCVSAALRLRAVPQAKALRWSDFRGEGLESYARTAACARCSQAHNSSPSGLT